MAIISAAKKDFNSVTDDLLNFVKERTLDKKVRIIIQIPSFAFNLLLKNWEMIHILFSYHFNLK